MGKPTGFMEYPRQAAPYRPAKERLLDFNEIYINHDVQRLSTQSARCMDCGVPFCQSEEHSSSVGIELIMVEKVQSL